jgi:FkbH-like protein
MYQFEWFDDVMYKREAERQPSPLLESKVDNDAIEKVLFCHWEEHCLECAPPLCYSTCSLYTERGDKKCRRIDWGVGRNKNFSGLFPFGADMRFRKWGRITAQLYNKALTIEEVRKYDRINTNIVKQANVASSLVYAFDKSRKINGALNYYRHKTLNKLPIEQSTAFDEFLIECFSFAQESFRLLIENNKYSEFHYRTSVIVNPGHNLIRIPIKNFKYKDNIPTGALNLHPENDLEARLVFTWLDFVKYKPVQGKSTVVAKPADKIKCIAWDLDNTMWQGVFIESTPDKLVINQDAITLIKQLDEKGVLQTITSKNTHEEVWPFIESLGISEYFLYPAINWGQKSESLKNIADKLNINVDTFGFIDDSPFERDQVSSVLPQVRIYNEKEIPNLLDRPEFDLPVTEESRKRRSYYMIEQQRMQIEESFSGDYDSFLKNCGITLNVFVPGSEEEYKRCYELIQRTNQLNLSARRYEEDQFKVIVNDNQKYKKYALSVEDRFGSYGIIGFVIVEVGADFLKIKDFVISCRVAEKKIENAFVYFLSGKLTAFGKTFIVADYTKTSRNERILKVFDAIGFSKEELGGDNYLLRIDPRVTPIVNDVITILAPEST